MALLKQSRAILPSIRVSCASSTWRGKHNDNAGMQTRQASHAASKSRELSKDAMAIKINRKLWLTVEQGNSLPRRRHVTVATPGL